MNVEVVCIVCPLGCRVTVSERNISGYKCPKGRDYAYEEATNPVRVYTGSVKISNGDFSVLPVRSVSGVPKNRMRDVASLLRELTLHAPVRIGQVVIADVLGTGVDIVATRSVTRIPESFLSDNGRR
jgi:CxxC motif-containing protein